MFFRGWGPRLLLFMISSDVIPVSAEAGGAQDMVRQQAVGGSVGDCAEEKTPHVDYSLCSV